MKKLYNELFYVSENKKVREKVMLARTTVAVCIMISCLIVMCLSAYGFFTSDVSSALNTIKAGRFDVEITITYPDGTPVGLTASDTNGKLASLEGNVVYDVTLKPVGNVETGFCVITAKYCTDRYHTQQLGKDQDDYTDSMSFKLQLSDNSVVSFLPHWGTSSFYDDYKNNINSELYIENKGDIKIAITAPLGFEPETENTTAVTQPSETKKEPVVTSTPETSKSPEISKVPETTKSPETTALPETDAPAVTEQVVETQPIETTSQQTESPAVSSEPSETAADAPETEPPAVSEETTGPAETEANSPETEIVSPTDESTPFSQ